MVGVEEADLDAAESAEHPAMLAADLALELVPLVGDHVKNVFNTYAGG